MNDIFSKFPRFLIIVFLLAAGLAVPSRTVSASVDATFTVNSNSDADDGGDGLCTLREAMLAANGNWDYHECVHTGSGFGNDLIVFSISGSPVITLTSTLPTISYGTLTIDGTNSGHSVVIDGAAAYEPFYIASGPSLTLQNLTVQNGFITGIGGGAFNEGTLKVLNSSFLNNVSTSDGGAINNFGTLIISNSTFSGNHSSSYGGGLENNGGTATILNSTFSGNSAPFGGGALATWEGSTVVPVTTVKNTILANSTAPQDCYNGDAGTPSGNHNIIESSGGYGSGCTGITTSSADPMLAPLTGSPAYFPLLYGSPALDAGSDSVCAASPVSKKSENGKTRPQGPHCEIGAFESIVYKSTINSVGSQDGWVLESSEFSSVGGTMNSGAATFRLGDDAANKQYRSLVSFNTGTLPDTAHLLGVTLRLKKQSITGGGNPIATFFGLMLDIKKGSFGTGALQTTDFQAGASHTYGALSPSTVGGWYSVDLTSGAAYVNKLSTSSGLTQIRLRFNVDDNNNAIANYLSLNSGNAPAASQPQLVIQYYVP